MRPTQVDCLLFRFAGEENIPGTSSIRSETGPGVQGFKSGDIVTLHCYLSCGHCRWCRVNREPVCDNLLGFVGRHVDGGYAEYIKLPARNFIHVPEGIDYKNHPAEVAVICDAIATPYKVVRRARIAPLETVTVFGAGRDPNQMLIREIRPPGRTSPPFIERLHFDPFFY